jgi:hypothetical protein
MRCLGVAIVKVRGRGGGGGLVWGWIGVFLLVFFCRELLFYSAVARFHSGVQGKDRVSQHGGDRWCMVMERGLGMGKAVNGLCLHGYMLNLVWVELEGVLVGMGGPLQSAVEARGARDSDARVAEAHRPRPTRGLGVGRYRLLWG